MPRSESLTASLVGTIVLKAEAIVDEKQPYIVAIFAVNVSEGRVQDLRDGIQSRGRPIIGLADYRRRY